MVKSKTETYFPVVQSTSEGQTSWNLCIKVGMENLLYSGVSIALRGKERSHCHGLVLCLLN